jgi:hypothetical protein
MDEERERMLPINPVFSLFSIEELVESGILTSGQLFYPDTFVENFNTLPIEIRSRLSYKSITTEIDGVEEIVAYMILVSVDREEDN